MLVAPKPTIDLLGYIWYDALAKHIKPFLKKTLK